MSTKRKNEELNPEQLSQVTGGEDGGFRRENPGIGPKKGILHGRGDASDNLLDNDQLSQVTGGEDGGFRHENPGIGPTEGLIK
jgi:hypothetical protein